MSFVSSQSLPKLLCISCKKYLSQFPIYIQPNKGSTCGRCPVPTEPNAVRNETYESIAQSQKFPCCYDSNGCTENFVPSKIPRHEKFCPFMKCDCPALSSANCGWNGFVKDLPEHFEAKHLTLYLRDAKFELDFINSYAENCLLPFGEESYIVSRKNNSKTKTFSCTVSYIGTDPNTENYVYQIVLENEKKSQAPVITNKLNAQTTFNVDFITGILDNPSSIIATINILEQEDTVDNPETEAEENFHSAVNYDLLKELECIVCFEYMLPPIHQCLTGHSICTKCKNTVDKCPTCRAEFKNTQNFSLAQVINHIVYPCKHKRCKFTSKAKDIRKHEASCIYGPFDCPLREYEDCTESLIFTDIEQHIANKHFENLLELDTVSAPFEMGVDQDDEDCFILKFGFRLFKMHYRYQDGRFCWAVQLIGSPEESLKYMFEIDIIDTTGKNRRAYFKSICGSVSDRSSAFDDDKSFIYIDYKQIRSMITNDFTYRVRVLHE